MKILNFTFLLYLLITLVLLQSKGYAGSATAINYGSVSKPPTAVTQTPQAVVCPTGFTSNGFQCVRNSTLSNALSSGASGVSSSSSGAARVVRKSTVKPSTKKSSGDTKAKKDDGTYAKSEDEKACEDRGGTWNGECEGGGPAQENVGNQCLDSKDPSCSKAPVESKEDTQVTASVPAGCTIISESSYNSFPPEQQKNINVYAKGPEAGELTICPPAESSGAKDSACKQQFQQLVNQCQQENTSAIDACNQENQSMQQAANAVKVVGAGSVASVKLACSKIGEISKIANGALAAFQGVCATFQGGCEKTCSQAQAILNSDCFSEPERSQLQLSYANDLKGKTDQCIAFKKQIQEAAQHALAAVAQQQVAKQCEDDTSLTTNSVNDCTKNPTSQYCVDKQKCSDPTYAAKNQVCSCYADPTGSACLTAMNKSNSPGTSGGGSIPGVKTSGGSIPGVIGGTDSNGNGGYASQGLGIGGGGGDGQGIGGKQGDASSAGKGANGNNAGGSQGSAASHGAGAGKDPLKVNSGSYGGTQGGSFGAGYFGKTSSGGGTNGALPPTTGRRDIAKFDPRKYITGLGGKAEYINMSSENIFKIVKMRYEGKKSTLLPEDYNIKK